MTPQCHVTISIKINMISFRFTPFKRCKICNRKYSKTSFLLAFLRLCYLSVVTYQCPTYKINTDFPEIESLICFTSVDHLEHSVFNIHMYVLTQTAREYLYKQT